MGERSVKVEEEEEFPEPANAADDEWAAIFFDANIQNFKENFDDFKKRYIREKKRTIDKRCMDKAKREEKERREALQKKKEAFVKQYEEMRLKHAREIVQMQKAL